MATETVRRSAEATHRISDPDKARVFLAQIEQSGAVPEGSTAADAAAAVLCPLVMRLSVGEARHLIDGLPEVTRPLARVCESHRKTDVADFGADRFLSLVMSHFDDGQEPDDPEELVRVVFRSLHNRISTNQISDVGQQLPAELKEMWLQP